MNIIYSFLLTFDATFWMIIVFCIKNSITIFNIQPWFFHILLVVLSVGIALVCLLCTRELDREEMRTKCVDFSLADNEFLPVYLGYFFVSIGIDDWYTMNWVFIIVFVFTFLSNKHYFNPLHMLLGYHYYHVQTDKGTKIFVILKGKVIKNAENLSLENLRRINDVTFVERR